MCVCVCVHISRDVLDGVELFTFLLMCREEGDFFFSCKELASLLACEGERGDSEFLSKLLDTMEWHEAKVTVGS